MLSLLAREIIPRSDPKLSIVTDEYASHIRRTACVDMLHWFAGAEYTHQKKKRKKTSNKEASLRETVNRVASPPSAEAAAEPALPMAVDAATGDADADTLPTGTEVEGRAKKMMKRAEHTKASQSELAGISLSPSNPFNSKEKKSNKAVLSSCINGSPPSLNDVPTLGNGQLFHTGDDKVQQVGKASSIVCQVNTFAWMG